jgi:hypothetical protein
MAAEIHNLILVRRSKQHQEITEEVGPNATDSHGDEGGVGMEKQDDGDASEDINAYQGQKQW